MADRSEPPSGPPDSHRSLPCPAPPAILMSGHPMQRVTAARLEDRVTPRFKFHYPTLLEVWLTGLFCLSIRAFCM